MIFMPVGGSTIAETLLELAIPLNPEPRQKLETQAGYFSNNHERMQYLDFQRSSLPIVSGAVEAGAKQSKKRVAASGMHWSRAGLENIIALRAASISHAFDDFWQRICPF